MGALCGEAIVFTKKNTPNHFLTLIKQQGALIAKGRLLGVQFDTLFTDDLYFKISRHAIDMAELLKKLLTAGFPAEYALRTLNSLCALRGLAGAVTVDLAQLQLDTGKVMLYKWGAAPSYLLTADGSEKIGTAGPPPGLSVTDARETVERLSLRRGETLVLCSDGAHGEDALRCWYDPHESPGELAARILESGALAGGDDATVAIVRLKPNS